MESWWCTLSALLAFSLVLQLDAYVSPVGVKPGECPKQVLTPLFKPCADKCSNDNECTDNEKCCYQGCGRTCVATTPITPIDTKVKPGECPKHVFAPYFKPCADKCSNDDDCAYNEKCCYQGCGRTCVAITPINPIVRPGECPKHVLSPYIKPCADKCSNDYDCASNEKCCYHGCGRTCVAITPIDSRVKPGECPKYVLAPYFKPCADKCSNDYDCAYNEKCCYQGCGRTCVAITLTNPGVKPGECPKHVLSPYIQRCPDKCSNDYDCAYNEKCCYQGCGRTCVAIKPIDPRVKPGECPKHVLSPYIKPCADKCSNDYDCAYNEKCCYQGCGRTCVVITLTNPVVRPGECPKYVLSPYIKRCADKCSNDYDCAYNEKCCYHGCGRTCVAITLTNPGVKPGECPKHVLSPYIQRCPDKCSNDYDCAYNEKCCYQGCGRTCVAITPIKPIDPIVKPGECPKHFLSPYIKPCADKCSNDYDCAYNEKCCYQGCGRTCVAITPIDSRVKPGECPKHVLSPYNQHCPDKCSNDYDCDYNEKCCYQGCGRTCVAITPINPIVRPGECPKYVLSPYIKRCADKCSNDHDCAYNEKCCYHGCGRTCVAITLTNPGVKPGECPKHVLSPYIKPCADKCSNDYDCAYNEKCCYQGCGRTCVAITLTNPVVRPGECPKYVLSPYIKRCADKCSNDHDCAYNEKCCYHGCGRTCVAITLTNPGVKPGECPKHVLPPYIQRCPDKCSYDYDCAYNEKCCYQGCGRTCVAITPIKPIDPIVKPGECPKYVQSPYNQHCPDKCSNDYDCAYNEKCCYQGCGRTCVAITPINPIDPRVKPGECPKHVLSPYIKPCADKCSNDYDCAYNEKCCYQGCGRTCVAITPIDSRVKPGECPKHVLSPYIKPCADKCSNDYDCAYNEKCCYQGCGRTCVAITLTNPGVKPGECPKHVLSPYIQRCADKCSNDYDCAYNEKCCYQGCGRTCVAITPIKPIDPIVKPGECPKHVLSPYHIPCADKCSNDYDCAYNEKCCYQGCGRTCVAITPIDSRVKPGECPKHVQSPYNQRCPDKCSNDYDCAYNEKCCYQGCGRTCVAITPINPINPIVKPGECPKHVLSPYVKHCPDKCSNDYDCAYNEKCCYQGCGRTCVAITLINPGVKPGECPKHVLSPYNKPCADKCSNDYDCAYNEKCCYHGCGRACVVVKQEKPGVCPIRHALKPYGRRSKHCVPVNRCSDDYSCPGNKKCCTFGCGQACLTPQLAFPCKPYPSCLYNHH